MWVSPNSMAVTSMSWVFPSSASTKLFVRFNLNCLHNCKVFLVKHKFCFESSLVPCLDPLFLPNFGGQGRYAFSLSEMCLLTHRDVPFLFQRLAFSLSAFWRVSLESQTKVLSTTELGAGDGGSDGDVKAFGSLARGVVVGNE